MPKELFLGILAVLVIVVLAVRYPWIGELLVALAGTMPKSEGTRCRDGSLSHSVGRGTCSWHGGIADPV
jgi:hypothetical protein